MIVFVLGVDQGLVMFSSLILNISVLFGLICGRVLCLLQVSCGGIIIFQWLFMCMCGIILCQLGIMFFIMKFIGLLCVKVLLNLVLLISMLWQLMVILLFIVGFIVFWFCLIIVYCIFEVSCIIFGWVWLCVMYCLFLCVLVVVMWWNLFMVWVCI